MGRTANRRAANSANRRINAATWFYGQSFNGGTRGDVVSTYKCFNCGETAEHGKPHACDTTTTIGARIASDMLHDID